MNPPILIPRFAPRTTRSPSFLASSLSTPRVLRCPPTTQTPMRPNCLMGYHGGNTPSPLARAATSAPKPPAVEHPRPAWGMRPYTSCTFLLALSHHGSPLFSYSSPTRIFLNILVSRFEELVDKLLYYPTTRVEKGISCDYILRNPFHAGNHLPQQRTQHTSCRLPFRPQSQSKNILPLGFALCSNRQSVHY